jgi:hypothetical protein
LDWLNVVLPLKEKQLDGRGIREKTEKFTPSLSTVAPSAVLRREWGLGFRLPNVAFPLENCISGWHGKVPGCWWMGHSLPQE